MVQWWWLLIVFYVGVATAWLITGLFGINKDED